MHRYARSDATVLIRGESGTGKELAAQGIHNASARRGGKAGLIETAHRGTLFFDEIAKMPLPLQSRLLRVLQECEVVRLGSTEPLQVDVRIVAATHRALIERAADIALLARHLLGAARAALEDDAPLRC